MSISSTGDGAPARAALPSRLLGERAEQPRWVRHTEPRWAFVGLVASAVLVVPMLAVAWSSIRAADTTVRVDRIGHVDSSISLDYRFLGDPSPVYPSGVVATKSNAAGALIPTDPLYSRLLHHLELALAFGATDVGADTLTSSYSLDVTASMPSGWSTTLTSVEPTSFQGHAVKAVVIDLDAAAARVAQVAALTGVGGDEYTITVAPRLDVEGAAKGQAVRGHLEPPVTFAVQNGVVSVQALEDAKDSQELAVEVADHARYGIGPVSVGTQAARGVLGGAALVLLGAAGWCASVLFGGLGLGESARIAARYRSQMVDVAAATAPPGPVVMVSAIDELARLAKVEQSVILHEDLGDGCHRYRVFLGSVTYEYETAPEHAGSAATAETGAPTSSTES